MSISSKEQSRDPLGSRLKEQYESRTQLYLPRRTYTIIRVDGKAFHSYTHNFKRPFDSVLSDAMDATAIALCKNIQGARIGFVQSDEISIVATDFDNVKTEAWFNGNLQKIVSISASTASVAFNNAIRRSIQTEANTTAAFDARAFTICDREEVMNYLIWRQQDATRNSIQMVAQSLYSHKELHGKKSEQLQEMIFQKGQNWNDYPSRHKRGSAIIKIETLQPENELGETDFGRHKWTAEEDTPIFTQEKEYLDKIIPSHGY